MVIIQKNFDIARQLKTLRDERDLSIRSLCALSGLAVNTLSLIENGKTSPSVKTLFKLANALDVPITSFFDSGEINSVIFSSRSNGQNVIASNNKISEITSKLSDPKLLTAYTIEINPGSTSGTQPFVHEDYEFILCLEGKIRYLVKNDAYILETGDSLLFKAYLPHRWLNEFSEPAQLLAIFIPSLPEVKSTIDHF